MNQSVGKGVLSLHIKDKLNLYRSYMSFVKNGGLFIPTRQTYHLNDKVTIFLTLLIEDKERLVVTGEVIWITPVSAGTHTPGIGVAFDPGQESSQRAQTSIETLLGNRINASELTHTL